MGNKKAGTAYVSLDGEQLALKGGWECNFDPYETEALTGQSGVVGYKEMHNVPFIAGDAYLDDEITPEDLAAVRDATVQIELADGKVGVLQNAWKAGTITVNSEEGTMAVRFEGLAGEWL